MPRKRTYTFATPSLLRLQQIGGCDASWFKHWDKLWKAISLQRPKLERAFIAGLTLDKKEGVVLVVVVIRGEDFDDVQHYSGTRTGKIHGSTGEDEIPFPDELFLLYPTPRKKSRPLPPFDF